MAVFFDEHAQWLTVALIIVAIVLAMTIFSFWHKRYADRGYKKGVARNPQRVREQHSRDHPAEHPR